MTPWQSYRSEVEARARIVTVEPDTVAAWPAVRRDVLAAYWAILLGGGDRSAPIAAGAPSDRASLVRSTAQLSDAMLSARAMPECAEDAGRDVDAARPILVRIHAACCALLATDGMGDLAYAAAEHDMEPALPYAQRAALSLLREMVPHVAADPNPRDGAHLAWTVLQETEPPPFLAAGVWPVAATRDRIGVLVTCDPGLIPAAEDALVWLTRLRSHVAARGAVLAARALLARPAWREHVAREALALAAEHADAGPARDLARGAAAHVELDSEVARLLGALVPQLGEGDARETFARFLTGLGAEGSDTARRVRSEDAPRWSELGARLAFASWCDVVAPRRGRVARVMRIPATTISAALSLRKDGAEKAHGPTAEHRNAINTARRRDDRSFEIPTENAYLYVIPWRGSPLLLPTEGQPAGSAAWREVLTGGVLRAHVLTWDLWDQQGRDATGRFLWIPHRAAAAAGRRSRSAGVDLDRDFQRLTSILIAGVDTGYGKVRAMTPEALVQVYEHEHGARLYRHAPMTVDIVHGGGSFVQVPRALVDVDPRRLPLGLGLASLVREGIVAARKGDGAIRLTLREALERAGEDTKAGARKEGRAYWTQAADRLASVAKVGDLAAVRVEGADAGPEARTIVEPSATLLDAYQGMTGRALAAATSPRPALPRGSRRPRSSRRK